MSRRGQEFVKDLAERPAAHSGLNYAYFGGKIKNDNVVTLVSAGSVALTASSTNFVEVDTNGAVSANTNGFTSGRVPMAIVVTGEAAITSVADRRTMVSTGSGSGATNVYSDPAYWMGV